MGKCNEVRLRVDAVCGARCYTRPGVRPLMLTVAKLKLKLGDRRSRAQSLDLELSQRKADRFVAAHPRPLSRLQTVDQVDYNASRGKLPETLSRTDLLLKLLPPEQLKDMRRVFNMFDADGGGSISASEVGVVFRRLNLITNRSMLKTIVENIDADGDGRIDFGEFCALMTQRRKLADVDVGDADFGDDDGDETSELGDASDAEEVVGASSKSAKRQASDLAKEQQRQQAIRYFKHAVATMAFRKSDAVSSSKVFRQLWLRPPMRSEWELQRVLHCAERFEFIQQLPPAVQSDQRVDVCRMMRAELVQSGEALYRQGDPGSRMYFLFAGQVELRRKMDGADRLQVTVKQEFESFGQEVVVNIATSGWREETAIATTECCVASLSRHDWIRYVRTQEVALVVDLLQSHPAMTGCKREVLLRMALEFKPVRFYRCVHSLCVLSCPIRVEVPSHMICFAAPLGTAMRFV